MHFGCGKMMAGVSPVAERTVSPRPVTADLLVEFVAWTRTADMFRSSPQGEAFGEELREVFKMAAELLGQRSVNNAD